MHDSFSEGFYQSASFIDSLADNKRISDYWATALDDMALSTQEFYQKLQLEIESRELPKVKISRTSYAKRNLLSKKREYLKVTSGPLSYIICAAPYGKDFFFSYRVQEKIGRVAALLERIPIVGRLLTIVVAPRTFYTQDSHGMFLRSIQNAIIKVIEDITGDKGVRQSNGQAMVTDEFKR